jgi:hypothetical protein
MNNPLEVIEARLNCIENLILDLKHETTAVEPTNQSDDLLTVQQAAEFLSLAVPTIYSMVSREDLAHMKRFERLYFSKLQLIEYLKKERKKSNVEVTEVAEQFMTNQKKGVGHGK